MASRRTTAGRKARIFSSPSSPSSAVATGKPSISRMNDTVSRMLGSSSTSKMSALPTCSLRLAHDHDGLVVDRRRAAGERRYAVENRIERLGRRGEVPAEHALQAVHAERGRALAD